MFRTQFPSISLLRNIIVCGTLFSGGLRISPLWKINKYPTVFTIAEKIESHKITKILQKWQKRSEQYFCKTPTFLHFLGFLVGNKLNFL
jgi:hypothetical protein